METQKIIILSIFIILSVAIFFTIQQFFNKKAKTRLENLGGINPALAVINVSWLIGFFIINVRSTIVFNEYVDVVLKVAETEGIRTILKTGFLFVALVNLWVLIMFFLTSLLLMIFYGKISRPMEVANNNYSYFLIEGMLLAGLVWSFLPIFETVLRVFFPVEVPFYR